MSDLDFDGHYPYLAGSVRQYCCCGCSNYRYSNCCSGLSCRCYCDYHHHLVDLALRPLTPARSSAIAALRLPKRLCPEISLSDEFSYAASSCAALLIDALLLGGETGLICRQVYTPNRRWQEQNPRGEASLIDLVGLASVNLALKNVRGSISHAGGRFSRRGNC